MIILEKEIGETPLECLERFRGQKITAGETQFADIPMTYAGRLDPMASGKLLVLFGEECKNKERYLGLDKEYEVNILFGVKTDTLDVLGLLTGVNPAMNTDIESCIKSLDLRKYVGVFNQPYPAYSSKTVNGKQLHVHARAGTLPGGDQMPSRRVEIYSIKELTREVRTSAQIATAALEKISKVKGDFRQKEIIDSWKSFSLNTKNSHRDMLFTILTIRVKCGSGAYMRSLAERIGNDVGVGAIAFSINRTKIGDY